MCTGFVTGIPTDQMHIIGDKEIKLQLQRRKLTSKQRLRKCCLFLQTNEFKQNSETPKSTSTNYMIITMISIFKNSNNELFVKQLQ